MHGQQSIKLYSDHGSPCIKAHITVREIVNVKVSDTKICVSRKSLGVSSPACERNFRFHPTVVQMGFLLGKMAMGQAFLRYCCFFRDKYYSSKLPYPSAISLWHSRFI